MDTVASNSAGDKCKKCLITGSDAEFDEAVLKCSNTACPSHPYRLGVDMVKRAKNGTKKNRGD